MRARRGVAEEQDELLLDVGRDRVLPAVGFAVHLLPLEPDHVGEQSLGQPVPPHDRGRERAALRGEVQAAIAVQLDVAVVGEAPDRFRNRCSRQAESLDEARAQRDDTVLLDREDRFEVFLGCVVEFSHRT